MSSKVVITNEGAQRRKYGKQFLRVERALVTLVAADRKRGIEVRIVRIDSDEDAATFGFKPVRDAQDEVAVKEAVDAVHTALDPHYMMLLDGPDVIPQQTLTRGVLPDDDDDVPSDLPYACDVPASQDARSFVAPTRIVGRLPGITGVDDPRSLLDALRTAATWKSRPRKDYGDCFAVAAQIMRQSTAESLKFALGHSRDMQVVPPRGFRWPLELIGRRTHFLNCHGVESESEFEGQLQDQYPLAHSARYVAGRIKEGTVAAVECCYGAQLYDPRAAKSFDPMVNTYLRYGAYAYFGSSTTSYGADIGNAGSDLICQSFLRHVLRGASCGRAVLEARQEFLKTQPALDPMVMKTVAQFGLFGDPSIHPVYPLGVVRAEQMARVLAAGLEERRSRLRAKGRALRGTVSIARLAAKSRPAARLTKTLLSSAEEAGGSKARIQTYTLHAQRAGKDVAALATAPDTVHVVTADGARDGRGRSRRVLVVTHVRDGKVVAQRVLHSRGFSKARGRSGGGCHVHEAHRDERRSPAP